MKETPDCGPRLTGQGAVVLVENGGELSSAVVCYAWLRAVAVVDLSVGG